MSFRRVSVFKSHLEGQGALKRLIVSQREGQVLSGVPGISPPARSFPSSEGCEKLLPFTGLTPFTEAMESRIMSCGGAHAKQNLVLTICVHTHTK